MNKKERLKEIKQMIASSRYDDATAALAFFASECRPTQEAITSPDAVRNLLKKYAYATVEYFLLITLDSAQTPIAIHEITKGIKNNTMTHPREVFRQAILDDATSVILAHNHPSGKIKPSDEDRAMQRRLVEAGKLLGIQVLDSMIVAKSGFYSALENQDM